MKLYGVLQVLMLTGVAGESLTNSTDVNETLSRDEASTILKNRNGWVNPEDLMPMPQCIAQQDQYSWLNAMTKCTQHKCTSWFIFCTHYQWLTQLSCLSAEFSPSVVKGYMKYCSRSILAKAQLYHWIHGITGRRWLVDVGDSYGLESLSPESLKDGYTSIDIANEAPACLKNSMSSTPRESFRHVLGSCSFTAKTQHTGNAARPWEYNEDRRSMTTLSFDTVGYDLTNSHIPTGEYFDKACFCDTFTMDQYEEPCWKADLVDLTMQRRWLNETCGYSWREKSGLQPHDMIPWKWIVSPGSKNPIAKCPPNEWKLMSIALVNLVTLFSILHTNAQRQRKTTTATPQDSPSIRWILGGLLLASIHVLANAANAYIIQNTPGYEAVPILQLTLLWCSLPRLSWLPISSQGQPDLASATSSLFAEVILQGLSLYHMCLTVNYGRQHDFYFGGLSDARGGGFAGLMYAAALIWLLVVATMAVPFIRAIRYISIAEMLPNKEEDDEVTGRMAKPGATKSDATDRLLPKSRQGPSISPQYSNYGTMPPEDEALKLPGGPASQLYMVLPMGLPLLWLAQWLFWVGYICLSSEE
ncbi:hypothetical protein F53441_13409 [Fusarium austroafricanum]|uniref:Uncharacterized protein n=1 Tax=Fusarium austroafricanum TaxID=2364996 RepID=A0A8H4NL65_9HYPO|nr:hypothetical protein F53441_13409 [Fusarium austroafricanum]